MTTSELPQVEAQVENLTRRYNELAQQEADATYEGLDKNDPDDAASWARVLRERMDEPANHTIPTPFDDGMWTATRPDGGPTFAVEQWETGAIRDTQDGKPRLDFINPRFLLRIGNHLTQGADRYGDFNFDKGIPSQRYMASLMRHLFQYYAGDRSEDHLSAVFFGLQGIAMNEGTELDDLHRWNC